MFQLRGTRWYAYNMQHIVHLNAGNMGYRYIRRECVDHPNNKYTKGDVPETPWTQIQRHFGPRSRDTLDTDPEPPWTQIQSHPGPSDRVMENLPVNGDGFQSAVR